MAVAVPVAAAAAKSTAATVTAVSAAAAAAIGAFGVVQQGKAARDQADFQSAVQRQQAERERQNAAIAEKDFRRDQSRLMAARRAQMGASGVEPSTGSPLLTSEDFAGEVELQAQRIRAGGEASATRLQQQALLTIAEGNAARTASFFRAGSSLLSAASKAGAFNPKPKPQPQPQPQPQPKPK